jgi:cytochrome c peroxidase
LTGQTYVVTDPGRALISGNCVDIGKTKVPILRGLASRAPYFHNGSAATLLDLIKILGLQGIEWVILRDHSGEKACG